MEGLSKRTAEITDKLQKLFFYVKKLTTKAWSAEQFLEASSFLFADVPELDEDEDESNDEDIQISAPLLVVELPNHIICDSNPRNALIMP
jgi:hypothetical protein